MISRMRASTQSESRSEPFLPVGQRGTDSLFCQEATCETCNQSLQLTPGVTRIPENAQRPDVVTGRGVLPLVYFCSHGPL